MTTQWTIGVFLQKISDDERRVLLQCEELAAVHLSNEGVLTIRIITARLRRQHCGHIDETVQTTAQISDL